MEARKFFLDEKFMYAEHLLLSRILYRMKQKFRSAKEFKALAKLHKALSNYFQMPLAKDLQTYAGVIPSRYKSETYLPNKNLLDYILLKFQGVVKLMERIFVTSQIAASMLQQRISIGHFWKVAIILFALVSRIHVLAKYIANCVCEYYRKLYPFSLQMKNNGSSILPDGYEMCEDLKKWLNVDWLDIEDDIQILDESPEMPFIQYFNLADDDDDDDDEDVKVSDEYVIVADDDELEIINSFKQLPRMNFKKRNDQSIKELRGFNHEDIGEVIEVADETITSNLFDSKHEDLEQFDQSDVVCLNDSVIEIQSEADMSSTSDVINISDVNSSISNEYCDTPKNTQNIVRNVEDIGVNALNTHNTHTSNLLGANEESDMYNFRVVDTNQEYVEDDDVIEIDKENQQNVNTDLDEALIIDDSIVNNQAEDVGEIVTNKLDCVPRHHITQDVTDTDIVLISDTEIKEKTGKGKSTLQAGQNSVRNRNPKRSNMTRLIEKIEKDKNVQSSKKVLKKKVRETSSEVIEVDSLSDSSVIIVDEFNKTESKVKSNHEKKKQKRNKLKKQNIENDPPKVSLKINPKKKKKLKKQRKQPVSNPNTISNNSNNQTTKMPNVPSTSGISTKVKKKPGKAGKEHLEKHGIKRKSDQKTIGEMKKMKFDNQKVNEATNMVRPEILSTPTKRMKKLARKRNRELINIGTIKSNILKNDNVQVMKVNKRKERKLKRLQHKFKGT